MEDDCEYRQFTFKYNLEDQKDNNEGELQNLYDDGWNIDFASDEIIHKNRVFVFYQLTRNKYKAGEK